MSGVKKMWSREEVQKSVDCPKCGVTKGKMCKQPKDGTYKAFGLPVTCGERIKAWELQQEVT